MRKERKKAVSLFLAACVALGSAAPYAGAIEAKAAANLTDGLVGHWDFENGALTNKAANSQCSAEKVGSGVTLKEGDGVSNGSVYFSKAANSYLKLNMNNTFNAATGDFTLAAWVKYDADGFNGTQENMNLFQQADGAQNPNGRTILYLKKAQNYGCYLKGGDTVWNTTVELGSWHHVAVTSNHSTGKAQLYLNGTLAEEKALTGTLGFYNGATNILVGAHKNAAANSAVKGSVDELRVYNKVADADTIKAMYDEFAGDMEVDRLKTSLQTLVAEAKALSGGTEEAQTNLQAKIAEAEALLTGEGLTAESLTSMKEALQAAVDAYRAGTATTIAVNTSDELREVPDNMFGINHRYHKNGYGTWDPATQAINPDFNALAKEMKFGSVRWPGGTVSNLFTWKDSIGPLAERTPTIAGNNFYSNAGELPVEPGFGLDEAMRWIYDDLGSEAIYVYGFGRGSAQDAADLVEYLNAPNDGSNPGGGIDWAAERAKNGHEEPYGVTRFELGNEFSDTGQNYWMAGRSAQNKNAVDLYIEGDRMIYSSDTSYFQHTEYVVKKGDWRPAASNGDGTANQERYVCYTPVVTDTAHIYVGGTEWNIVDSLEGAGAANVCTLDCETGKITFGDGTNGNIPQSGQRITAHYSADREGFVDHYTAMKKIADEIGIEIKIYSGIVDRLQKEFITKMNAKGYNDKYDGVIIHPYSSGYGNANAYEASLAKAKAQVANIASHKQAMDNTTHDPKKEVAVSEFGILSPASNYQTSLGHALYIANHMVDCVNAGAAYQNKHCLVDFTVGDNLGAWQQCVIQCHNQANGYKYVATPSAHLFALFNNMTGDTEVNQTVADNADYYTDSNGTVKNVNVYSTKDKAGNVYVLLINNQKSDSAAVKISVDGRDFTGKTIDVWQLTSENVDDMNTLADPNKVGIEKTSTEGAGTVLSYTLAPHSVTSFKIPAVTAPKKVMITTKAEEGGSVSESLEAEVGSEATVTATAKEGYEFAGWYKGAAKVSADTAYTFTVEEAVELTAKFSKKEEPKPPVTPDPPVDPDEPIVPDKPIPGGMTAESVKTTVEAGKATLSWAAVNGADGYAVELKDAATGQWKEVKAVTGSTYTAEGLKAGTTYAYRIRAYKMLEGKRVYFADEAVQTVKTPDAAADVKVAVPKKLKAKKTAKGIKLTWKKVPGASGYLIYRSYKKNKGFKKIATIKKGSKKSYLYKKAKKGKVGYYKIKAYVNVGGKKVTSGFSKRVKRKR